MSIVLAKQPPTIPGYRRLQQHWQKLLQQHRKLSGVIHGFDSAALAPPPALALPCPSTAAALVLMLPYHSRSSSSCAALALPLP